MTNTAAFYKQQLEKHQQDFKALNKKLIALGTLRLLVFLASAIAIYFTFNSWRIALIIGIIGAVLFIYLLTKYTDVKYQCDLRQALVKINEDEIKIASGDFQDRDEGLRFQNPNHYYSLDVDLFGKGSFFQLINRTVIIEGTNTLVKELTANSIVDIKQRQEAIKELSNKSNWRQDFSAIASLIHVETPALQIIDWLKKHQPFLPKIM